uniref:Peptidase S9A N-terminal domain-containing protein n=1 Tax=Opuntia streptacantha TaxID=393608 RepID=A0A7C9DVX1_OPUST
MDTVVFTEDDPRYCVDITCTKDGNFISINSNSRTSSEVYVIDATNPLGGPRRVHRRIHDVQYFLEHHHGFFYVLTNRPLDRVGKLGNRKLCLGNCGVEDINSGDWQVILFFPQSHSEVG